jgi:hypothetical protein
MIDPLAPICYPHLARNNRNRFLQILKDHSGWPHGELVSLPVLAEKLRAKGIDLSLRSKLLRIMRTENKTAGNSVAVTAFDLPLSSVGPLCSGPKSRKLVEDTQHFCLIYSYRNFLVHEFREPGYGMEAFSSTSKAPCYHSFLNVKRWVLVYPEAFFEQLARDIIMSATNWLELNLIDPYKRVPSSWTW